MVFKNNAKYIIMNTAYLIRTYKTDHTAGIFVLSDGNKVLFTCNTLELPYLENKNNISCIPADTYNVVPYSSAKFPNTYQVQNVSGRDKILIHKGNTKANTEGCILVGVYSKDGVIVSSKDTLAKLKKVATSFKLVIIDGENTERGLESVIPAIISLFSNLAPNLIQLISQNKKGDKELIIRAILATDASAENKILLIETILNL